MVKLDDLIDDEEENPIIKELIIQTLKFCKKHHPEKVRPSKRAFHKILFKLKQELPSENKIKDELPYYWYYWGVYSSVVARNIDHLENKDHIIVGEKHQEGGKLYSFLDDARFTLTDDQSTLDEYTRETDKDLRMTLRKLEDIVKNFNFFNVGGETEKIYKKYQPFEFQHLFRYCYCEHAIKRLLINYCALLPRMNPNRDWDAINHMLKNIDDSKILLFQCEISLPRDELLIEYNEYFSNFVTASIRFLHYIINNYESNDILNYANGIKVTNDIVWRNFGNALRVLKHDKYYDKFVPKWKSKFEQQLKKELIPTIEGFYQQSINVMPEKIKFSPREKQIWSSVVDTYLKRGI